VNDRPAQLLLFQPRWVRFFIVGAGANLVLFVLTYLFQKCGVAAFAAGAGAYLIAFLAAYVAQRDWTFGSTRGNRLIFPRYLAAQVGCALASGLAGHFCTALFAATPFWTSVSVTATAGVTSYVLSSRWVFAGDKSLGSRGLQRRTAMKCSLRSNARLAGKG
jgi:putative flippase GtrA